MANEFKIKKGLIVTGADGGTVVDIQGSQGQLFSVTDDLSGSIFAVSDISGVPILDVNSSGTIQFSDLGAGTLVTDANGNISVSSGGGAGGPYLPLSAGSGSPLTGDLWLDDNLGASPSLYLQNGSNNYWRLVNGSTGIFSLKEATSDRITILPGGNVGIGSTSASSKLELGPNGSLGADITNKNVILNIDGGYGSTGTPSSGQYKVIGFTGTTRDVTDITGQTSGEVLKNFYLGMIGGDYFNVNRFSFWQGGDERLTIQGYGSAAGNVGIGDTSPVAKLDVAGDVQATSFYNLANPSPIMFPEGGTYNGAGSETGYIVIKLPDTGGAGQNNMMTCLVRIFDYASNESFDVRFNGYFYGSDYLWTRNAVWIDSSANVDRNFTVRFGKELGGSGSQDRAVVTIGEASGTWSYPKVAVIQYTPGHSEGAQPQIWNSGWNVSIVEDYWDGTDNTLDDTITNNQVNNWRRNGQDLYYGSGTGNVGIGATNPGAKLELKKETTWGTLDNQAIYINNTGTGGDTSLIHDMGSITWRSSSVNTAAISGIRNTPGSGNNVDLRFTTATQSGGQQTSMTISSGGNVGIGTTSPVNKLNVEGDIGYTGVIGQGSIYGNTGNNSYANMQLYNPSTGYSTFNNQSYGYYFLTGGGTKMTILNNGNVGIGATNPRDILEIEGNMRFVNGEDHLLIKPNNDIQGADFIVGDGVDPTYTPIMSLDGQYGGKVTVETSVGSSTNADKTTLDIQGSQGQLFSVTDDLSGDIFSVADISGVPIMNVNSDGTSYFDGNVGINNSSPTAKLEITGDGTIDETAQIIINSGGVDNNSIIRFTDDEAGQICAVGTLEGNILTHASCGDIQFKTNNGNITGNTDIRMFINQSGSVGIGTVSPNAKLNVNGGIKIEGTSSLSFGGSGSVPAWGINSSGNDLIIDDQATTSGDVLFNNNGSVGIGTTTPGDKLHVNGTVRSQAPVSSDWGLLSFNSSGTSSSGVWFNAGSAQLLLRRSDNSLQTKIVSSGNSYINGGSLGLGTTSPNSKLDVISGTNNGIRISATDTTSNWRDIDIRSYVSQAQANAFPDGSAIYTTNPTAQTETAFSKYGGLVLQGRDDVNSSFAIRLGNGNGYATRMFMGATGATTFSNTVTATNFILSSDERLKENVKKVCDNRVKADWKTFELKTDKGQKRYGVIAQELEKSHPEFVNTDVEGFKSVKYIDLLIAKIAELEARLEKLEK